MIVTPGLLSGARAEGAVTSKRIERFVQLLATVSENGSMCKLCIEQLRETAQEPQL